MFWNVTFLFSVIYSTNNPFLLHTYLWAKAVWDCKERSNHILNGCLQDDKNADETGVPYWHSFKTAYCQLLLWHNNLRLDNLAQGQFAFLLAFVITWGVAPTTLLSLGVKFGSEIKLLYDYHMWFNSTRIRFTCHMTSSRLNRCFIGIFVVL